MAEDRALLDACVIIPVSLCDTLLRAAGAGLYRPLWSEAILAEVRRNLVGHGLTDESGARRRLVAMTQAFPDASIVGYEPLVPRMTNPAKDRHVLAAAVTGGARVIVTDNLRDFPARALAPHLTLAQTPDDFLLALLGLNPTAMHGIIEQQASALRRPAMTATELLDNLERLAPLFVEQVRAEFD